MSHDSAKEQRLGSSDSLSDAERHRRIIKEGENDFGFTLHDNSSPVIDRGQKVYSLIKPLLNNLAKGETQDVIKWNGVDRIKQMKKLISDIEKVLAE